MKGQGRVENSPGARPRIVAMQMGDGANEIEFQTVVEVGDDITSRSRQSVDRRLTVNC